MIRMWLRGMRGVLVLAAAVAILAPATAQAQITRVSGPDTRQAFGFNLGYFALKGEDARCPSSGQCDDVLVNNLESLAFDIKDFNTVSVGGEWLVGLGDYLEAGVGVGFTRRTVPSVYRDQVNVNGSEIAQDLKLRTVPFTATVRFLPIGRRGIEPYVGAGIAVINWRYTETGEFVDFDDSSIFRDSFEAKGNAVGPVILGGIRFPVADVWDIGGEIRYQKAKGDTGGFDAGFLGTKIDLGGLTASVTMHVRF